MKKIIILLFLQVLFFSCAENKPEENDKNLLEYVNPLIGTDSDHSLSNGNTYPAIALPRGMNFWSPQTALHGGWFYTYAAKKIIGFKQTHQPSPWMGDYGAFSIMPMTGKLTNKPKERASWFSHKREIAQPHYYKAYLGDYDVTTEITPTERAVQFRITYPASDSSYILLDAFNKGAYIKVLPLEKKIIGYCQNNSGGVPKNFKNYFVILFDKNPTTFYTWHDSFDLRKEKEAIGETAGAIIQFSTKKGEVINLKIASSFISQEQAELNLQREIGKDNFNETKEKAEKAWNKELNRIKLDGGSKDQKTVFYTALYRTLLFPRIFYEFDKDNQMLHYSPYNGKVLPGYMFTDNGFWDTFRAVFPFFTLMYPDFNNQLMKGLVNTYKESGWLPEWASPGHRNVMIGSNSAANIADAWLKGIRDYDIQTLYEAILKNSENEGPLHAVGRYGVKYYNQLGFIPYNVGVNENVARSLEYSYDDFTIMKLAEALNRPKSEIDTFAKRARYYKNVFDTSTNFMRGKNLDGSWQSPFVPDKWGDAFTEGSSWHYTWSVFHDPQGLIDLMGGNEAFTAKLDSVFSAAPTFDYSYYGFQIHEITEMVIAGMGQYAHGNQPIQHAIYLYNYAGQPWKAQKHVREVMDLLYTPNPDGLCGDEDNGQTSAWFVFSAMGFYPVCPGSNQYVLGSPLFKKITLQLENKKTFTIEANNNSEKNVFIKNAILNGKDYKKNWISHDAIMKGGIFKFEMDSKPNKSRGISKEDFPYSLSNDK